MIDHISFGVSNLSKSIAFYDAALAPLGIVRVWTYDNAAGYGYPGGDDAFAIKLTTHAFVASDRRSHVAFVAKTRAAVIAFYDAALASGAIDEGAPAVCTAYGDGYFAAFVRDRDDYRLEAVLHEARVAPPRPSLTG